MADNRDDLEPTCDDPPLPPLRPLRRLPMLTRPTPSPDAAGQVGAAEARDEIVVSGGAAAAAAPLLEPEPVLDPQALARLSGLDPNGNSHLIERVLVAFQTSVARLRPQAEAARASGDRAALRLVAHTLKSSSASIGAMRLSQLCARIETAIRLETLNDHDADLDALGGALDDVLHAVERLLKAQA